MSNNENEFNDGPVTQSRGNHQQRRTQQHREVAGDRWQAQNLAENDAFLKTHLLDHWSTSKTNFQQGTSTSVPTPVTTRGIGFNTISLNQTAAIHVRHAARFQPEIVFKAYRVALLQAKYCLFKSQDFERGLYPSQDFQAPDNIHWDERFYSAPPITSFHLATSLVQFGSVRYGDSVYKPYIPKLRVETVAPQGIEERTAEYNQYLNAYRLWEAQGLVANAMGQEFALNPPAPVPPPPQASTRSKIDPFLVTIDNLRYTVETLANPALNLNDERAYFRRYNPLPGAIWGVGDVLTNPDQIMPAQWDAIAECDEFVGFIQAVKKVDQRLVTDLSFDGKGRDSLLTTVIPVVEGGTNFGIGGNNVFSVRSHVKQRPNENELGLLGLCTERPPENEKIDTEEWVLRSPRLACSEFEMNRVTLVADLMNMIRK